MKIILRLDQVKFREESDQPWWISSDNLTKLITSFQEAGLWEWFRCYGKLGSTSLKPLPTVENLIEESKQWKAGTYIFSDNVDGDDLTCDLDIDKESLSLTYFIARNILQIHKANLLNKLNTFVYTLHELFQSNALIGPSVNIEIYDIPFKHVHPPRFIQHFGKSSIVNYLSKSFFQEYQDFDYLKFERLLNLPMPEGCYREGKGDLVILHWADHITDLDYLAERLAIREQWLVEAIDPDIDDDYNALGDCLVSLPQKTVTNEFVTFYDPINETGYKTFLVNHDWTIDEELFSEMSSWLKLGQLPDGNPLRKLNILLSDRESALFIYDRAKEIGLEGIYYVGDYAQLWNPFPQNL